MRQPQGAQLIVDAASKHLHPTSPNHIESIHFWVKRDTGYYEHIVGHPYSCDFVEGVKRFGIQTSTALND